MACSVQIQAVNSIGSSPLSPALLVRTRPLPPAPPPLECSAAGPQSLKLKWGENASNTHTRALLADDMVYTLQMEDKNHRWSKHTHRHSYITVYLLWEGVQLTVCQCTGITVKQSINIRFMHVRKNRNLLITCFSHWQRPPCTLCSTSQFTLTYTNTGHQTAAERMMKCLQLPAQLCVSQFTTRGEPHEGEKRENTNR